MDKNNKNNGNRPNVRGCKRFRENVKFRGKWNPFCTHTKIQIEK